MEHKNQEASATTASWVERIDSLRLKLLTPQIIRVLMPLIRRIGKIFQPNQCMKTMPRTKGRYSNREFVTVPK